MRKNKIVYICSYSNDELRHQLSLSNPFVTNYIGKLLHKDMILHTDKAPWNPQFIHGFENDNENEYYVITRHLGMKHKTQTFDIRGVHYFVYNDSISLINRFKNSVLRWDERTDYRYYRKLIRKYIESVKPDLVVVCGAENPIYSWFAMDIPENIPVFVILQTLMNDPKRIAMGISSPYRMKLEERILKKHHYFGVTEGCQEAFLRKVNPKAVMFPMTFPCNCPDVQHQEKQFDFMFVAGGVSKNKGIEDVIKAMAIVCKKHPSATLNVSGAIKKEYKDYLVSMIEENHITPSVSFQEPFLEHKDVFVHMTKARCLVVPGITAGFNSTVKEGMLLGLPTICYETSVTHPVNNDRLCLITAKMEDVDDLAAKMVSTIEDVTRTQQIAIDGYNYARFHFTADAVADILIRRFKQVLKENGRNS